jgi:hypothetical protein
MNRHLTPSNSLPPEKCAAADCAAIICRDYRVAMGAKLEPDYWPSG